MTGDLASGADAREGVVATGDEEHPPPEPDGPPDAPSGLVVLLRRSRRVLWAAIGVGVLAAGLVGLLATRPGAAVGALALGAVACGGGHAAAAAYRSAQLGLCRALGRARTHDPEGARREFFDSAHALLHQLAAEVAARDRPAAAHLLEAKQVVEGDLMTAAPGLAADLERLTTATAAAVATTGAPSAPCPKGGK